MSDSVEPEAALDGAGGIDVESHNGSVTLRLSGDHDTTTASLIVAAMEQAAGTQCDEVVVDLSDVSFMDSSTLGCLVRGRLLVTGANRRFEVRAASRQVWLFELCGLTGLLHPSVMTDAPATAQQSTPQQAVTPLESWVAVPARPQLRPEVEAPPRAPAHEDQVESERLSR